MTKLRIGVLGLGIGRLHVLALLRLRSHYDLVAVADPTAIDRIVATIVAVLHSSRARDSLALPLWHARSVGFHQSLGSPLKDRGESASRTRTAAGKRSGIRRLSKRRITGASGLRKSSLRSWRSEWKTTGQRPLQHQFAQKR